MAVQVVCIVVPSWTVCLASSGPDDSNMFDPADAGRTQCVAAGLLLPLYDLLQKTRLIIVISILRYLFQVIIRVKISYSH